jgi:hypothetical protein
VEWKLVWVGIKGYRLILEVYYNFSSNYENLRTVQKKLFLFGYSGIKPLAQHLNDNVTAPINDIIQEIDDDLWDL